MKIKLKHFLFRTLAITGFCLPANAQNTSDTLEAVTIIGGFQNQPTTKQKFALEAPSSFFSKQILHLYQLHSLDKLLQNNAAVFIKNYGINNLSTLSIRGTSAAQSQVLWQGLPLNNAVTGYTDLSQLHTGLFDEVGLHYGINATLYGSGSIGGAVLLENHHYQSKYKHFKIGTGSFGQLNGLAVIEQDISPTAHLSIRATAHRAHHRIPLSRWNSENDFLENARAQQAGLIIGYSDQLLFFSKKKPLHFQIHSWVQYDYREIPPALFEKFSSKNQNNIAWRNAISFEQQLDKSHNAELKYGYQWQQYRYADSASFQHQEYDVHSQYAELGISRIRPIRTGAFSHNYYWIIPLQFHQLRQKNNAKHALQSRIGIAGVYRIDYRAERLSAQLGWRQEYQDADPMPSTAQAQISSRILFLENEKNKLKVPVYISWQNAVRMPTINELYYFPGGNKNLLPEYSNNIEVGGRLEGQHLSADYELRALLQSGWYARRVHNWIYWLGNNVWTPHNIAEVYSRGWDWKLGIEYIRAEFRIQNNTEYAYTIATTQQSLLGGSQSIGKQIPYTPRYLIQNNLSINTKRWGIGLNTQYTGYRFTNLDETAYLSPYWLWNAHLLYNVLVQGNKLLQIQVQCFNITDALVESVPGRPMAPRHFVLSASMSL